MSNFMSSLVLELQRDALDASVPILALLRKSLVVAKKLNIQEFQHWVQSELNGYDSGLEIPKYRFVRGELKAFDPYQGWILMVLPLELADIILNRPMPQPVSTIQSLVNNTKSTLHMMSPEYDAVLRSHNYIPYKMALHIDKSQVYGVLEAVRDIVLKWSLELEEDGILGEGMTFSKEEKQAATQHDYSSLTQIFNIEQSQMQNSSSENKTTSETFNNNFDRATIASFANKMQDNAQQVASNFSQNINQNVDEIERLIVSLREMAKEFPEAQREEAMVHLDDLQEDITTPNKQKPQRVKTRLVALLAVASLVAGATDFTNNVLEISNKLGIPLDINISQVVHNIPALQPDQHGSSQ
jgi:hypothetical protein